MEEQIENIPQPIFTKHPIHFRRPQEFHCLVYTVYIVGKELGIYNLQTPSPTSDPMSNFFMEMVGITAVATLMEGKNLKYVVFVCILVCFSCVFSHPHHYHGPAPLQPFQWRKS